LLQLRLLKVWHQTALRRKQFWPIKQYRAFIATLDKIEIQYSLRLADYFNRAFEFVYDFNAFALFLIRRGFMANGNVVQ
jgi:hypothetical protein